MQKIARTTKMIKRKNKLKMELKTLQIKIQDKQTRLYDQKDELTLRNMCRWGVGNLNRQDQDFRNFLREEKRFRRLNKCIGR